MTPLWLLSLALAGEPPTELMYAANAGDPAVIVALIAAGARVDARDGNAEDALAWAVRARHLEAVRALLRHGADVNGRGHCGRTPLVLALESVQSGDVSIVRALLEAGARVDVSDDNRVPLITSATRYGTSTEALRLVLARAKPAVLEGWHREPAVAWVVFDGEVERVRLLLEHGFPPDLRDADRTSPLELAARHGQVEIAVVLLGAGAPVTARAFEEAAIAGHRAIVAALLPGVTDLDAALVSAAVLGDLAVVEDLLGRGARPDDGAALEKASFHGHLPVVERLVRGGADVGTRGEAALVQAAEGGHDALVAWLLARGVPVDASDGWHRTALARAAIGAHVEVVERLLRAGARDLPDREGLRAAAQIDQIRGVQLDRLQQFAVSRAVHPAAAVLQAERAETEPRWRRIEELLATAPQR